METFAWLQSHQIVGNCLRLVAGPGHVTMKKVDGSYAGVKELIADPSRGALLSAVAVTRIHAQGETRYVMLQRDLAALVSPGRWQIPAGRCSPDENPNECALRELAEEVGLRGVNKTWEDGAAQAGEHMVCYRTATRDMLFAGQWAVHDNTYAFYVFLDLMVDSLNDVELFDLEPYGRKVAMHTESQLLALLDAGELADSSEAVVRAMLAAGQLKR